MRWFLLAFWPIVICLSPKTQAPMAALTIEIKGVQAPLGVMRVALYDSAQHFLDFKAVAASKVTPSSLEITTVVLDSLPSGTFAVALYQDQNNNGAMDKNWIGIPKEPLGFSMASLRTFGPPSFQDCAFKLEAGAHKTITIPLENNQSK